MGVSITFFDGMKGEIQEMGMLLPFAPTFKEHWLARGLLYIKLEA